MAGSLASSGYPPTAAARAPERLTTGEVCKLARLSRATLWRRIAQGRMPRPIDRGRQALFCAEAIAQALTKPPPQAADLDAVYAARFDRLVQRRADRLLTLKKLQNKTAPNSEISSEIGSGEAGLGPLRRKI